jgi:hypothetical protein
MIKLLPLITENESQVQAEEDLGKPHILGEKGYNHLKSDIEKLNKRAVKWGVPPMELKVLKEEFVKKSIFVNAFTGKVVPGGVAQDPAAELKEVTVKQYQVQLIGEPPRVEGYRFIAKIEHTEHGNILNYAPKESDKHLPHEYRTGTQKCDVCQTTRDRNNTFILKLEKEDPQRFPNKHVGEFIMVGSSCLKRFLPNRATADSLMSYAEIIEMIRDSIKESEEMGDDFGGGYGGIGNYISQEDLGFWVAATYLHTGKYLSKKKADEFSLQSGTSVSSTVQTALSAKTPSRDYVDPIYTRVQEDKTFKEKAEKLTQEFLEWSKSKDFDIEANKKPEFSDFFHNLKVLSKQNFFKKNNSGLFGALFATFLRDKGEFEKRSQSSAKQESSYLGKIGEKIRIKVKINKIKEYESAYGQGLIINMTGESTETDANGQPSVKTGNVLYFTTNFELEENEEAEIEATVKNHQINKYTQLPETQITRAKVVNFITHPEKNAGKTKIKDLSGTVKIERVDEQTDWRTGTKSYIMNFHYDGTVHPEMRVTGAAFGIGFYYDIPDEATYLNFKNYSNKTVKAKWSLTRATTLEKLKSTTGWPVSKFVVTEVVG